jgi:hypothetical protein
MGINEVRGRRGWKRSEDGAGAVGDAYLHHQCRGWKKYSKIRVLLLST